MPKPRKPLSAHKREGTFRKDRHGSRGNLPATPAEPPTKPKGLPPDASELWDLAVGSLPGILTPADGPMLEGCCRWWAIMRQALISFDIDTAAAASRRFEACVGKLGLSPAARNQIDMVPPAELDPLEELRLLKVNP